MTVDWIIAIMHSGDKMACVIFAGRRKDGRILH